MELLFYLSFLYRTIIHHSISLLTASLLLPLAAADSVVGDKWMPESAGGSLHSISTDLTDQSDSSLVDITPGFKSNGQRQTATGYAGYSKTINNPLVQEEILLDVYYDIGNDAPLPVEKDFTKCRHRRELLSAYSNASSAFIECAVQNAKPVLFCGHCVVEFDISNKALNDIENDEDCKEDILVSDKLQIVSQTQGFLTHLWQNGFCQNCYDKNHNFSATNSTKHFLKMYSDTMTCFLDNGGSSDEPIPIQSNLTLCKNCSSKYKKLNEFYNGLSDDQLCMDLIDLMNRTRVEWKDNHCQEIKTDYLAVITLSTFICILPFFFYITAMLHGTKKQQKLVEKSKERNRRALSASARLYAGTTTSLR